MRAFIFLLALSAHAAARPCDPNCDHKNHAKAKARVTSCVPSTVAPAVAPAVVRVDTSCAPSVDVRPVGTLVATVGDTGGCGSVAIANTVASPGSAACGVGVQSSTNGLTVVSATPSAVASTSPAQGLAGLAQAVRRARGGEGQQVTDEEREEVRAAVEEAREVAQSALEEVREAQREADESVREALRDARTAQTEAAAAQRSAYRDAINAQRQAQERLRAARTEHPDAFAEVDVDASVHEALENAQRELAKVDLEAFAAPFPGADFEFSYEVPSAQAPAAPKDIEERIRALERIAGQRGHGAAQGSIEERVAALERALGQPKAGTKWLYSGPQAQFREGARAYALENGKLKELQQRGNTLRVPSRGRAQAAAPSEPATPTPPAAPLRAGRGLFQRSTPPPADAVPAAPPAPDWNGGSAVGPTNDERRAIEESMRSLRAEADALRSEVQRMRAKIDSLPRER